jgi:DNA-binding MarR family transcriptional regulator
MDGGAQERALDFFRMLIPTNRMLERIMDKAFRQDGLTYKQWLVLAGMGSIPGGPPSLGEVASVIGTSHQNVRQIAGQLERKGFIEMERDPEDRRVLRLSTTEKNARYWEGRDAVHASRVLELFKGLGDEEIALLHDLMARFEENVLEEHRSIADG